MKRIATFLLALVLVVTLLPAGAQAANGDKLIALTFDDGPSQYTSALLDGLAARGAHVSFFIQGCNGSRYTSTVRRAWQEGHQICSHTYDHPQLTRLSAAGVREQLSRTDSILDGALGFDSTYMLRPPYGAYNQSVLDTAGVPCFYWSVDTRDWESRNADAAYQEFLKAAKDGSIVLMHDLYSTSVTAALRAIDTLQAQGYEFVTLSELFYRRGIALTSGKIYFNAYPGSAGTADGIAEPVIQCENTAAGKLVTITGDSRGTVYYTTNGEIPTPANCKQYTGPFLLNTTATIRAVSVLSWNSIRSDTVTARVDYIPAAAPELTLTDGMLTMTSATSGAAIRYTTDESAPTESSTAYTEGISAVPGTTYRARAYAASFDPSVVTMLTYGARGSVLRDVAVDDWYYETCDRAVAEGLIAGVAPEVFAPNQALSRAMLVAILYRMEGLPEGAPACAYTDVDQNGYYYPALCWATDQGIVSGYPDGSFAPNAGITRQELCSVLMRYLSAIGKLPAETPEDALSQYADGDAVGAWARNAMNTMCALGIVAGYPDHTVRPNGGATRAEAVALLLRTVDAVEDVPEPPADVPEPETPPEEGTEPEIPPEQESAVVSPAPETP